MGSSGFGRWIAIALSSVWVFFASAVQAEGDPQREAEAEYREAVELYAAGRHAAALEHFERSMALVKSPNALLGAGRALRELGRLPEAVEIYEQLLARLDGESASEYARTRRAARSELESLYTRVGSVRVVFDELPPKSALRVGDRAVSLARLDRPFVVLPGPLVIVARAPGFATAQVRITLAAGEEHTVRISLLPEGGRSEEAETLPRHAEEADGAPAPRRPLFGAAWAGTTVGAVGFAAFGTFFRLARTRHERLVDRCLSELCEDSTFQRIRNDGRTYQLWTNVSLSVGLTGVLSKAVFFIVDLARGQPTTAGHALRKGLLGARF